MDERELLKRLQEAFREEAGERLISIDNQLIVLGKDADKARVSKAIEIVFRDTHSLKGAARAVGMQPAEMFFQAAENVFDGLKKHSIEYDPAIALLLQYAIGIVEQYMNTPENTNVIDELNHLSEQMKEFLEKNADTAQGKTETPVPQEPQKTEHAPEAKTPPSSPPPRKQVAELSSEEKPTQTASAQTAERTIKASNSMRINKDKIDILLMESDELISLKMMFQERLAQINELRYDMLQTCNLQQSLKSSLIPIRQEIELLEDSGSDLYMLLEQMERNLENLGGRLEHFSHHLHRMSSSGVEAIRMSSKMIDDFREELKTIALMPFSSLSSIFPRMMREIAVETGKEFEFSMEGGEIEIDRRILDELRDPLIHLLRNAADHGIEPTEKRLAAGKPEEGHIELQVTVTPDKKIEIVVRDDGRGMNIDQIRRKIAEDFHFSEDKVNSFTDEKVISYIFNSSFSTSKIITSLSGRGLGMAIVREKVQNIGGAVQVKNSPGKGCEFVISLPAALSSQRGIMFQSGGQTFAIPTNGIQYMQRIKREDIHTTKGVPSLTVRGVTLPVFEMSGILGLDAGQASENITVMVFSMSGMEAALIVDSVLQESEMIVKPLGCLLRRVKNVIGVAVTGSGGIVPVLNTSDLLKSGFGGQGGKPVLSVGDENVRKFTIMIAEDSITSRTLLTSILEAAGYEVMTAVDGMVAWELLNEKKIDLLVSDIEMPRMDGFSLTEKVRSEGRFDDLPVVLVTSLARKEDRERGIAVGANAYITKGDFSQNHLLETIERLL